jgi:two-component system sensor histidine kinase HydH
LEDLRGLPLFAAVVAHELRNPLSAVKIALQTLERHSTLVAKDEARLRIALREVGTIEQVLTDVLDWARPAALTVERTSARYVLNLAHSRISGALESTGVRLEDDASAAPGEFEADPARLADALCELIANAAFASAKGGVVRVTVTEDERSTIFTVTDEGAGLSEEDAARAFDPFFSRRAKGIGLGLPRAKDIVDQHGGAVTLKRRLAGGARATIRLPRLAS